MPGGFIVAKQQEAECLLLCFFDNIRNIDTFD
jgi:hypothetical protein